MVSFDSDARRTDRRHLSRCPERTLKCFIGLFLASLLVSGVFFPIRLQAAQVKIAYATGAEVAAMFIKFGHAEYPYEARRSRRTGRGVFRIYINPDVKVTTVGVLRSPGSSDLDLAAAAGLYHCLAKPGGRREVDIPVAFTMGGR